MSAAPYNVSQAKWDRLQRNLAIRDSFFPTLVDYFLAHSCPVCKAQPGEECTVKRGGKRFHLPRQDRGAAHHSKDVRKAPPMEDRVAGVNYGTIPCVDREAVQ